MKLSLLLTKQYILKGIVVSISLILCPSIYAQTAVSNDTETKPLKQYDVEIILFKNIKVPKGSEKILPTQAPLLDASFISFANEPDVLAAAELGFIIPDKSEFRLLNTVEKIKKSSRYQLLSHMVWRQPGLERGKSLSVQIRTGNVFGNDFSSIDYPVKPLLSTEDIELQNTINIKSSSKNHTLSKSELVWYELEGKITISLARYLHTYVDLVLRVPSDNSILINDFDEQSDTQINQENLSFTSETLNNFSFKEHRRMRSRKLHYLDHPEIGMLILITPYEEPENIEFIDDDLNLG